jgi:hypothetical protein
MQNELEDISNILLSIYQKNLQFLKENFEDIFNSVQKLSEDIDSGQYKERYTLEYQDGYFDILNRENNSWFYGTNSYEDADQRATHTNFTKDGSLDLLRKGHNNKLIGSEDYSNVLNIVDFINDNVDLDHIEFQKIYKFVFIGVGLGIHIHEINKKIDPFTTLIIEPDLEIFRLSLFITDYSVFMQDNKRLFLCIGDENKIQSSLNDFYNYHNYMNYNIKHHLFIESYSHIKDIMIDFFSNNYVGFFPYKKVLENIHRTLGFIKNENRFLDLKLIEKEKILKDKEVLVVAAGPSLDNYIEFIKKYQNRFIIICVDVILRKLEKNGIVPDIVVSIDPSHLCAKYLTTENKDFLQNSTIVFLSQQHKDIFEILNEDQSFVFSQSMPLIPEIGWLGSVNNVGTFSFKIAVHLGATKIYTIGNDAAFNQETGSRYSLDSSHTQCEDLEIKTQDNLISTYDILEVKGNLKDTVKTNRSLLNFKDSFETTYDNLISYYEFEVYNLSDGVYINGFKPLSYDILNKNIKNIAIKDFDIKDAINKISKVIDYPDYTYDLKIINMILTRVKKYKKYSFKNRDQFLSKKLELMVWILEQTKKQSTSMFGDIFLHYTELVDIYINFILNLTQKELFNSDNLNRLNNMWLDGIIAVFKDIKKAIK